jgi:hypothetical protein
MHSDFDIGQAGKILMIAGAALFVAGGAVVLLSKTGLFRLPGDIHIQGEKWRFFFPVTTCILISVVLTLIFWIIRYFSQK